MAQADYRCTACDKVVTLELPRPEVVELYCCERDWDVSHECSDPIQTAHKRIWRAVSIGAVPGAGGSPAR